MTKEQLDKLVALALQIAVSTPERVPSYSVSAYVSKVLIADLQEHMKGLGFDIKAIRKRIKAQP